MHWTILFCLFAALSLEAAEFRDHFTRGRKSWNSWAPSGSIVKFRHSATEGATAKGALEIVAGPDNPLEKTLVFLNHYPVVPGCCYRVKVAVKGIGLSTGGRIIMSFQGKDAQQRFLGTESLKAELDASALSDGKWQILEYRFAVPETGTWKNAALTLCCLGLKGIASGQVFFDDFEFTEEETES